jgi:hypothetical protein
LRSSRPPAPEIPQAIGALIIQRRFIAEPIGQRAVAAVALAALHRGLMLELVLAEFAGIGPDCEAENELVVDPLLYTLWRCDHRRALRQRQRGQARRLPRTSSLMRPDAVPSPSICCVRSAAIA